MAEANLANPMRVDSVSVVLFSDLLDWKLVEDGKTVWTRGCWVPGTATVAGTHPFRGQSLLYFDAATATSDWPC